MPGYDQSIPIPPHLEPPVADADETLPSQMHPSYPFGRPKTKGQGQKDPKGKGKGVGNLLGTSGAGDVQGYGGRTDDWGAMRWGARGEGWRELGIGGLLESEKKREVPPGMAVSVDQLCMGKA